VGKGRLGCQAQLWYVFCCCEGIVSTLIQTEEGVSEYSVENVTRSLELLTFELPDGSQELTEQCLAPPLQTFHPFGRLPTEIRLMVWTLTLPSCRLVNLVMYRFEYGCDPPSCFMCPRPFDERPREAKPPVTLFVNKESRAMALEKYYVILQKDTGFQKSHRRHGHALFNERPLFINSAIDQVWMFFEYMFEGTERFASSYNQAPGCFDSIKTLELLFVPYACGVSTVEAQIVADSFVFGAGNFLKFFKNLETVRLVGEKYYPRTEIIANFAAIKDTFETQMFRKYYANANMQAPERVFHSWRRHPLRSDEDTEHEAVVTESSTE
jgi:hypothetical protein